jgi:hypothetical protein
MCLEVLVQLDAHTPRNIGAAKLELVSGLKLHKMKFERENAFHISTDGGCSCGLLGDAAEFEAETWSLDAANLEGLAAIIDTLSREKIPFRFIAHWLGGERQRTDMEARPAELAAAIRENRVLNNTLYLVRI